MVRKPSTLELQRAAASVRPLAANAATVEELVERLAAGETVELTHARLNMDLMTTLFLKLESGTLRFAVKIRWRTDGWLEENDGKEKKVVSYGTFVWTPLTPGDGVKPGVY